jgi:Spy/CpxP family protein refolding chaperone
MKTIKSVLSLMLVTLLFVSNAAMAQGPGAKGGKSQLKPAVEIPNLSADQKTQIQSLKTAAMKESLALRTELKEKRAHLNTLAIADKVDQKAIDNEIEAIGKLQTKLMKIHAKLRQDIRAILNDEQRVYFDTHYRQLMKKHVARQRKSNNYNKSKKAPKRQ